MSWWQRGDSWWQRGDTSQQWWQSQDQSWRGTGWRSSGWDGPVGGVSPPGASSSSEWVAHSPHTESVSGGKNPQEVHAQNEPTLLRIPFQFSIKKDFLGSSTWTDMKKEANERHLKVSIRALRESEHKSGLAKELGVKSQINISKLNPNEPIPLRETLDFYEDLMDTLEDMGLQALDPTVEEQRYDVTNGTVEVYMHGRLVDMILSTTAPPQVIAFTRTLDDASPSVERIFSRAKPHVFTRWHAPLVVREYSGRARPCSRSPRRLSDHAPALEQEAQPAAPAAGQAAEGEAPASGVSGAPEVKEVSDAPMGGVSPTVGGVDEQCKAVI